MFPCFGASPDQSGCGRRHPDGPVSFLFARKMRATQAGSASLTATNSFHDRLQFLRRLSMDISVTSRTGKLPQAPGTELSAVIFPSIISDSRRRPVRGIHSRRGFRNLQQRGHRFGRQRCPSNAAAAPLSKPQCDSAARIGTASAGKSHPSGHIFFST